MRYAAREEGVPESPPSALAPGSTCVAWSVEYQRPPAAVVLQTFKMHAMQNIKYRFLSENAFFCTKFASREGVVVSDSIGDFNELVANKVSANRGSRPSSRGARSSCPGSPGCASSSRASSASTRCSTPRSRNGQKIAKRFANDLQNFARFWLYRRRSLQVESFGFNYLCSGSPQNYPNP